MNPYLNRLTQETIPYAAGEQPRDGERVIKLNTNENPYPPSPHVAAAVAAEVPKLNLYPSPDAAAARRAFAAAYGVCADNVFVSNGSDEALAFAFMAFWDSGKPLATPALGYSFYPVYARRFDVPLIQIPMINTLEVDTETLTALPPHIGVILANPNAPTSLALPRDAIARITASRPNAVVLIDEAYIDFAPDSVTALPLLTDHPNLLITRTLSKSHSLAGMRVGFAVGSPQLIDGLSRVRDSFNSYVADRLAIAAAAAALADTTYQTETTRAVIAARDALTNGLRSLGFTLPDSSANFVLAHHPRKSAPEIQQSLRERGILVRRFQNPPEIADRLRISIGTESECRALLAALAEIV